MDIAGALMEYKDDIHKLCEVTGIREDKARYYSGEQAVEAVNTVIKFLKEAGCLPPDYGGGPQNCVLRMHSQLLGRDSELQQVLAYLKEHRWAAIVGGPGEGKSALAAELVHTLYADGQLPGGAYPVDLSLPDTEAALANHIAAQLINQLGNMEGAGKLAASPTWASLVQWLNRNDHALMVVLENVEAVIDQQKELDSESALALLRTCCRQAGGWAPQQAERLAGLCRFNALLLTIMSGLINTGRCSMEDALADAEQAGPLSLLEGAWAGSAQDDYQIRHVNAWLLKHLRPRELEAVAKLSLFRGSISLDNTLLMVQAPAERSPRLQDLMDCFRFAVLRQTARQYATTTRDADKSILQKAKDKVGEGMEKVAQAFEKDGSVGKQFQPEGAVGKQAQKVGGPFDKDGKVGKQFTDKGKVGGKVEKAAEKSEHQGERLQKDANKGH
ncbi:hypothetical protein WJX72_009625 [[Myrmecia] bisecta]|uniref:Uncharacterized protein n=1 Tax=[Myrmecia] bisecta TaxID=41462 RepID=A0AAW1P5F3_9CHLO